VIINIKPTRNGNNYKEKFNNNP